MNSMMSRLMKWQDEHGRPIRAGIAGTGDFGMGMVYQISKMWGLDVSVVADTSYEKAKASFLMAGFKDDDITFADSQAEINKAIEAGKKVVVEDGMLMPESMVDVTVDATGYPDFGAFFAYRSIQNGKHTVMVNLEADVVVGSILSRMANAAGVVYTEADGDQPSLIKGLVDWAWILGMKVVAAGKGTKIFPEYKAYDDRIKASYADGSKTQIEMACVANMTGFMPDITGMHKPSVRLNDIPSVFCPVEDGGILTRKGVVDVVNCLSQDGKSINEPHLQSAVFIVVEADNPKAIDTFKKKSIITDETGKYALIYRPYHLVGFEAPMSILKAVLYREATGIFLPQPVVDVVAVAKRDIKKGETLKGIGADTINALMVDMPISLSGAYLPYGMADNVSMNRDIPKGTIITYDMLEKPGTSFIWHLRGLQDKWI